MCVELLCCVISSGYSLKFVSAISYQIFIFSPNDSPSYEKYFLFHLKSSFRSQNIQIFVVLFTSFPHFPDSVGQMEVG